MKFLLLQWKHSQIPGIKTWRVWGTIFLSTTHLQFKIFYSQKKRIPIIWETKKWFFVIQGHFSFRCLVSIFMGGGPIPISSETAAPSMHTLGVHIQSSHSWALILHWYIYSISRPLCVGPCDTEMNKRESLPLTGLWPPYCPCVLLTSFPDIQPLPGAWHYSAKSLLSWSGLRPWIPSATLFLFSSSFVPSVA